MKKKKLNLKNVKVKSFVTSFEEDAKKTGELNGGWTGNCLSRFGITCPDPCDVQSVPLDECLYPTATPSCSCYSPYC